MRSNTDHVDSGGARRTRWRLAACLITFAVLAAACGSRLPDEVLASIDEAALGQGSGPAQAGSNGGPVGGDPTLGDGDVDTAAGGDASSGGAGSGGESGATGSNGPTSDSAEESAAASDANCSGGATDVGVTENEIVVANMSTDSGPLPGATAGSFRGAAAYFAKVNAEGGVCGRMIKILKGDDGLDPQRGRAEFLRLEPQVVAFVGSLAVADSGYVDLVGSTGVPYIGTFVEPAGREFPNSLPRGIPNTSHTGPFEYYKRKHPDVKRVGFMFADIGGVRANTPASREPLKKVGFEIVYDSGAQVTSPDFTPEVLNMQRADVEMVYLFAFEVNMHVRLARNMRQQNFEPKAKVSQIGYNSRLTDLLGDIANGWSNHIAYAPMLNADEPARNPDLAEFLEWNETTFPGGQIDLFPVGAWGDADLFVKALRALGPDVTREGIIDAINGMTEHDGGGIEAPINPSTGEASGCFVIVEVKNKEWVREHPARDYDCELGEPMTF